MLVSLLRIVTCIEISFDIGIIKLHFRVSVNNFHMHVFVFVIIREYF